MYPPVWPLYTPGTTDPPGVTGFFSSFSSTSTSAFTSYYSFSPTPPPPPPSSYAAAPLRMRAVVSIARACVRAYSRTCKVLYIGRGRDTRRPAYGCVCVSVCALGRRVRTGWGARARFSSLSHVHIRASKPREEKGERKRDTLPFLSLLSRDGGGGGGGAQSFTDPLSPTQARERTHHPCTHMHTRRFDFPIQSFPSGETRADLSCRRAVRLVV